MSPTCVGAGPLRITNPQKPTHTGASRPPPWQPPSGHPLSPFAALKRCIRIRPARQNFEKHHVDPLFNHTDNLCWSPSGNGQKARQPGCGPLKTDTPIIPLAIVLARRPSQWRRDGPEPEGGGKSMTDGHHTSSGQCRVKGQIFG
ncbi:hypothetical protein KM043_012498 [Ampulex compressa]|nr:hypothetical protein KM043_012498 [Ampulex compressa]